MNPLNSNQQWGALLNERDGNACWFPQLSGKDTKRAPEMLQAGRIGC